MVTGSRIGWPERRINLWDRALRVASSDLLVSVRMSSDVETG